MPDFELLSQDGEVTFRVRSGQTAVLGRGSRVQITVIDSSISRLHAKLTAGEQGLAIEDLQSTNGVFLNDAQVGKATARDGDVVKFGSVVFSVRRVADAPAAAAVAEDDDDEHSANLLNETVLRALPVPLSGGALTSDPGAGGGGPGAGRPGGGPTGAPPGRPGAQR
jgi:pSer/pThr/pTyr-binding forkhead associated (FHA) protein